jgi:hypothetical protein
MVYQQVCMTAILQNCSTATLLALEWEVGDGLYTTRATVIHRTRIKAIPTLPVRFIS